MMRYIHKINTYSIDIIYGNTIVSTICSSGIDYEYSIIIPSHNFLIIWSSIAQKHQISEFFRGNLMFLNIYLAYARSWLIWLLYLNITDSVLSIYHKPSLWQSPTKCCVFWTHPVPITIACLCLYCCCCWDISPCFYGTVHKKEALLSRKIHDGLQFFMLNIQLRI